MRTLRPITILATTAVVGLSLTGCGAVSGLFGGGGEKLTYEDSPLSEYFAALYGGDVSPEDLQSESDAQDIAIQESIAACMQKEGFEYTPDLGNGVVYGGSGEEWDPQKREWVEKYGYGVFNWPGMDDTEGSDDGGEEYSDPNASYVESLSESEQLAYSEVLNGASPTEEQMEDPEFDWNTLDQGCWGEAYNEAYNDTAQQELYDEYEPLLTAMSEVYTEAESLDAIVELEAKWAACMADANYPEYSKQTDAQNEFYDLQSKLYDEAYTDEPDFENATEEEIDAYYASTDPMKSDEWKEAGEKEITVALADLECREKIDYMNKALKAQFELEEQFIADNKAELEAFRAAAEQVM